MQAETGATLRVTKQMQVPMAATRFRRYATVEPQHVALAPSVMPSTALAPGGIIGAVEHRAPVSVVACITSYNFPMTNMAGKLAPALAMGNTVVVKPAWQDPLGVIRMAEVFEEAGFPPGAVNLITSETVEPAEAIVASPHVDMVSFTGSTAVGCRIASVAGNGMKRLLLELGDPRERDTVLGPVITCAHRDRVEGYVTSARDQGAEVAAGGERPGMERGFYVAPTLLAGCTPEMTVAQEEIFGPVIVAIPFDEEEEEEAVALANGTPFGLYDYVFSADTARAMAVARQLRSGTVGVNTAQRNHEAAFGGFKFSGVGRDGGSWGLHAYSEFQSLVWNG